jgi:hypothetical protein
MTTVNRVCANPNCGEPFEAKRVTGQFCTAKCRKAFNRKTDDVTLRNTEADSGVPNGAAPVCGISKNRSFSETGESGQSEALSVTPPPSLRDLIEAGNTAEKLRLLRQDHEDLMQKCGKWRDEAAQAHRLAGLVQAAERRVAELERENAGLRAGRPVVVGLVPDYPVEAIVAAIGSTVVMKDPAAKGGTRAMMAAEITALRAELDQERAERRDEARKLRAELRALQRVLYGKRDAGAAVRDPRWARAAEDRRLRRERAARWESTE